MDIYVTCPKNVITGGVELLHQLTNELNTYKDINASILYTGVGKQSTHPEPYIKYNNPIANINIKSLSKDDVVIFPEIWAYNSNLINAKSIIYWESVDNYFIHTPVTSQYKFKENTIHLAQSMYAIDFLLNRAKIDPYNIIYVSDYINDDYLNQPLTIDTINRKRQVLYNPSKGLSFTNKIIQSSKDITYIPIKGLTTNEVIKLMNESMLYIDFGDHPGKDRLPREAALCGCCIITGRNGSANFNADINIPDTYKFIREESNISTIIDTIDLLLDNYDRCIDDFKSYRQCIRKEPDEFKKGVKDLVTELFSE